MTRGPFRTVFIVFPPLDGHLWYDAARAQHVSHNRNHKDLDHSDLDHSDLDPSDFSARFRRTVRTFGLKILAEKRFEHLFYLSKRQRFAPQPPQGKKHQTPHTLKTNIDDRAASQATHAGGYSFSACLGHSTTDPRTPFDGAPFLTSNRETSNIWGAHLCFFR